MKGVFLVSVLAFSSNLVFADNLYCRLTAPIGKVECSVDSHTRWEGGWDGEEPYQVEYFKVVVRDSSHDGRHCLTNTHYNDDMAQSELRYLQKRGICPTK